MVVGLNLAAMAQASDAKPATAGTPQQKQENAASATKDNSAISGDQITKPAASKGSTLIGCLTGTDGKYMVRSMAHRTGVEVVGPEELKKDVGGKVKLTGDWQPLPGPPPTEKGAETRRFQVTAVELLAQKCSMPAETNPVSKQKQRQKQMEEEQQKVTDQVNPR